MEALICGGTVVVEEQNVLLLPENTNLYDAVTFDRKGVRRSHLVIYKALGVFYSYQKNILEQWQYRRSI